MKKICKKILILLLVISIFTTYVPMLSAIVWAIEEVNEEEPKNESVSTNTDTEAAEKDTDNNIVEEKKENEVQQTEDTKNKEENEQKQEKNGQEEQNTKGNRNLDENTIINLDEKIIRALNNSNYDLNNDGEYSIKELADELNVPSPELIMKLMNLGVMANQNASINNQSSIKLEENTIYINKDILKTVKSSFLESTPISEAFATMAKSMIEAKMKVTILKKVGELTANLTSSFADAFNVDQEKIAGAFKMNISEEQLKRIITAMVSKTEANKKINLLNLGYQKIDEPTYISFYFKSFDGKEHFKEFIKNYNEKVKADGFDDKEINYTDATGILMGSVKTIVNAVTYVLIAFISISLIVSSIMIGIITYISVYERTKEIGILRAIGASKRNISSIFNAETFIIGLLSGLIGIGFTYSVIPLINEVLHKFTGNIPLNVTLYISNAIVLVILSIVLTLIGGLIPAKAASKRDPVIALRTE